MENHANEELIFGVDFPYYGRIKYFWKQKQCGIEDVWGGGGTWLLIM